MDTSTARQECANLSLYTTSRTTDTAPIISFAGCQNSTALSSLYCSIRSWVSSGLPGIAAGSSTRTVFTKTSYIQSKCPCTRIQYFALAIILSDSGERMHRDKIPPQRMHAACRIVARGSCCAKRFAEFNGNCESYCSLEQLVASLSAANAGKSAAGTYHPKTERRLLHQKTLVQTTRCAVLWGLHLD